MKIYTRTGDTGETGLFGGGRVRKDDARVEAYGDVDETCAALGIAIAALGEQQATLMAERLGKVQEDLFAIGAHLATPGTDGGAPRAAAHLPALPIARIAQMETWMDEADERLPALRSFILPGGSPAASHLHLARTVCRRAERRVISLAAGADVPADVLIYLNRLSDLLFTFARLANFDVEIRDVPWTGG